MTDRNTQLYRTLPHEIGHYVDYLEKVKESSRNEPDRRSALEDQYHSRPSKEKEASAHRYADNFRKQKTEEGFLPFDRILDQGNIKQMGMSPK